MALFCCQALANDIPGVEKRINLKYADENVVLAHGYRVVDVKFACEGMSGIRHCKPWLFTKYDPATKATTYSLDQMISIFGSKKYVITER